MLDTDSALMASIREHAETGLDQGAVEELVYDCSHPTLADKCQGHFVSF